MNRERTSLQGKKDRYSAAVAEAERTEEDSPAEGSPVEDTPVEDTLVEGTLAEDTRPSHTPLEDNLSSSKPPNQLNNQIQKKKKKSTRSIKSENQNHLQCDYLEEEELQQEAAADCSNSYLQTKEGFDFNKEKKKKQCFYTREREREGAKFGWLLTFRREVRFIGVRLKVRKTLI
jgi:hypothetical protein